LTPQDH